ncbi:hypothetical protein ACGFNU_49765 [Spirillospora sp. NPDC048911]|uniref:hypothetical protein n=1 Tax=Spirillospora sp. NPDC048911 TaxID=3364527 RepID=UPI003718F35D
MKRSTRRGLAAVLTTVTAAALVAVPATAAQAAVKSCTRSYTGGLGGGGGRIEN